MRKIHQKAVKIHQSLRFSSFFCTFAADNASGGKKIVLKKKEITKKRDKMKKILYFVAALAATSFITTMGTSCKFAPDQHDGDTVAASEFYPEDTAAIHAKKKTKMAAVKAGKDSVGIYYIGSGSTKDMIQLVSYPSRRDTMIFSKTRHIKVKGNADINHVVRVDYYLLNGKDSLVKYVEEVELKTNH